MSTPKLAHWAANPCDSREATAFRELCNAYALLQYQHNQPYQKLHELDHIVTEASAQAKRESPT